MRELRYTKKGRDSSQVLLAVISGLILVVLFLTSVSTIINKSVPQKRSRTEHGDVRVTTQLTPESSLNVQGDPAIIALKRGDLYSIQVNNLSEKRLTVVGGFVTSIFYWFSPDQTKLVSKQNLGLWIVTKEHATPILPDIPGTDIWSVAWRSDSKALLIVHILNDDEECRVGRCPGLVELLTYDLETGKSSVIKQFKKQDINVVFWDKETQLIGYTVDGGEGGTFGTYHVFDLVSRVDTMYQTRWINPAVTPDRQEFIVFLIYDENGESHAVLNTYHVLHPDKPLTTFPNPGEHINCIRQTASISLDPGICLGTRESFWFKDGGIFRSFDTRTGIMSGVTLLPPTDGGSLSGARVLDVTKDREVILTNQKNLGILEYTLYDLTSGQSVSLGFGAAGPISSQDQFWTHEALGFLY